MANTLSKYEYKKRSVAIIQIVEENFEKLNAMEAKIIKMGVKPEKWCEDIFSSDYTYS
jgi:hypothetical protein